MIKKVLLILFILLVIPTVYSAKKCESISLNGDINFGSKIRWQNIDSEYQYPFLREFDILRLQNVTLVNTGECVINDTSLIIKIGPIKGYTLKNKHSENYGHYEIPIPELKPKEIITLKHNNSGNYYYEKNGQIVENKKYWHGFIDLDELGDWYIEYEINSNDANLIQSSVFINNNDLRGFRVYPYIDLLTLGYNSNVEKLTRQITGYTIVLLFVAIATLFLAFASLYNQDKDSKVLENIGLQTKNIGGLLKNKRAYPKKIYKHKN